MEMGPGWKKWCVTEGYLTEALSQLSSYGIEKIFILDSKEDPKHYIIVYMGKK